MYSEFDRFKVDFKRKIPIFTKKKDSLILMAIQLVTLCLVVSEFCSWYIVLFKRFFGTLSDIKYSYQFQIICTKLYGFKYSFIMLIIIWFQNMISVR